MGIIRKAEHRRGCGYRKPGAFYLVLDSKDLTPCNVLPIPLEVCPCCGGGFKYSRGIGWINLRRLIQGTKKESELWMKYLACQKHRVCPFETDAASLLQWVGKQFYSIPQFLAEAKKQGISRRIKGIPRGFKLGETFMALAHLEGASKIMTTAVQASADPNAKTYGAAIEQQIPGIFLIFKPARIEYVVKKGDSKKKLDDLEARGITLVDVIPLKDQEEFDLAK